MAEMSIRVMKEPIEVIEEFRAAWEQAYSTPERAKELVQFFHVPCSIVGADGALSLLSREQDVRTFLDERLKSFRDGGVTTARIWGVDVHTLADYACLLMLNWELFRADGSTERAYRICYNLLAVDGQWKILLSTYQSGS